jgi:hypothetical protein
MGTTRRKHLHAHQTSHYACRRFDISVAVTMKNAVFWDIKTSSYFTGDILRLRYRVQPVDAM